MQDKVYKYIMVSWRIYISILVLVVIVKSSIEDKLYVCKYKLLQIFTVCTYFVSFITVCLVRWVTEGLQTIKHNDMGFIVMTCVANISEYIGCTGQSMVNVVLLVCVF